MKTIDELKEELTNRLEAEWSEAKKDEVSLEDISEDCNDILDEYIPHYYGELLRMALEDTSLGYVEDSDMLPDKPNAFTIIQMSIWEILHTKLWEWVDEKRKGLKVESN
jgi:hypothetical protein